MLGVRRILERHAIGLSAGATGAVEADGLNVIAANEIRVRGFVPTRAAVPLIVTSPVDVRLLPAAVDPGGYAGGALFVAYTLWSGGEDRDLLAYLHDATMYFVNRLSVQPQEVFDAANNTLLARVTADVAAQTGARL